MPDEPLVNYTEAAAMCGVGRDAVRQWKSRRYLKPAAYDGRNPLFRPADVRAADEYARRGVGGRKRKAA